MGNFQQSVCQGGLAVVYMGNYTKISDVLLKHRLIIQFLALLSLNQRLPLYMRLLKALISLEVCKKAEFPQPLTGELLKVK
jgi:hypothetical protein